MPVSPPHLAFLFLAVHDALAEVQGVLTRNYGQNYYRQTFP
jgi:hypothetical protein